MDYLVLAIIIFTIILAVLLFTRKSKKVIEHIRSNWSKVKAETFYFERIRSYADAVTDHSFHRLTSQTLEDIDFDGIFAIIDRTTSRIGQQYLYKKLMEPTNTPEDPAQHLIDLFTDNVSLREEVQVELSKLNNTDAYNIPP